MYSSSAVTDIPSANVGGFFLTRCCAVGIPRNLSVLRTPNGVARVFYGVAMSAIRGLFSHRNDLRSQIPIQARNPLRTMEERERKAQQHFIPVHDGARCGRLAETETNHPKWKEGKMRDGITHLRQD